MGVKAKILLKPEATPTIFMRPNTVSKPKRHSTAVIIRERARLLSEITTSHGTLDSADSIRDDMETIEQELDQPTSNEEKGSANMEKEGCVRAMEFIKNQGLDVGLFVSDWHIQVSKWMLQEMPETVHKYDVFRRRLINWESKKIVKVLNNGTQYD
ncbi:PREDICTED: uncharacterized protein LOC105316643 [Amphimedon queenslandica]|uniref:Uncharacterized protein n=1 Tax=Amphimedon queenslandica TaxID=400682 RepID=A0AAN0IU51_AMPQE|nr:PREDICTED: uncharacterized protein LOC105316643 [Amphimedon queenslandica]|eukprot:XP_011410009.1 PREDICTED: uncharacterized protein LOC105316643 [Amphimedon queenslandica]